MSPRVLVSIVTYNSAVFLKACLESLKRQTFQDFSTVIWDNASADETIEVINSYRPMFCSATFSKNNIGFCAAQNRLISSAESEYVLVLNPDVVLESGFIGSLVRALDADSAAGSATGKLWRQTGASPARRITDQRMLDSTGIYFTPNQRHLDRGSGEIDNGQYERPEYVFGASGAAAFYRRAMLQETGRGTQYFDESFFAYREDADLAWRAQWMGWRCIYVPQAHAFHKRRVLPENRSTLPDAINMHSFKNRFLLRVKNMDAETYARFFIPITFRDLVAFGYVLLREWASFPGIPLFFKALPEAWRWRRFIESRRRASPDDIRSWFSFAPVSRKTGNISLDTEEKQRFAYMQAGISRAEDRRKH